MAETPASKSLTERLSTSVSSRGIKLAYGEVQKVDGADVLPVAIVSYGFGASDQSDQWGSGGGGGGAAVPIGAYVSTPDGVRFRPNTIALLAAAIPLAMVVGSVLVRLSRR